MTIESTAPDITEPLVSALSPEEAAAYPIDAGWDVTFGEIGFRLRPTPQYPYRRETERVSREQIDTSDEAGEQSLSSWWTRSQTSWGVPSWARPSHEVEARRACPSVWSSSVAENRVKVAAVRDDGSLVAWYGASNADPITLSGLSGYVVD